MGNFIAGKIGEATGGDSGAMSRELTLSIYAELGWIALGVGLAVLLLTPVVKRWMHLDTLQDEPAPGQPHGADRERAVGVTGA